MPTVPWLMQRKSSELHKAIEWNFFEPWHGSSIADTRQYTQGRTNWSREVIDTYSFARMWKLTNPIATRTK